MSAEPETIEGQAVEEHPSRALAVADELTTSEVVAQVRKIGEVLDQVMKDGEHYGVIPGTNKPSLLKPGAEKLCLTFRLAPSYPEVERTIQPDGHLDVYVRCALTHITTESSVGEGVGFCSTRETRYAFHNAARVCPVCGKDAIIKGKAEYGGGWLCWKKKDGCDAKFPEGDPKIEGQTVGKVAVENPVDSWNTVVKMAKKRALVDAVLTATAASDLFVQDLEDAPAKASEPVGPQGQGAQDAHDAEQHAADVPKNWNALLTALKAACDSQDWTDWIKNQRVAVHGTDKLPDEERQQDFQAWLLILARVKEEAHGELGLTNAQVQDMIGQAFDGAVVEAPIEFGSAA